MATSGIIMIKSFVNIVFGPSNSNALTAEKLFRIEIFVLGGLF
jgi:hypothetical protein